MKDSEVVETSTDELLMRCRVNPIKWIVKGIDPVQFSSLKPNAVEFVPGQQFVSGQQFVPGQQVNANKPPCPPVMSVGTATTAITAGIISFVCR